MPGANLEFELEMPAKPKYVGLARLLAGSVARRMSFSEENIDDLKLAISEMCTNAIIHTGNGELYRPPDRMGKGSGAGLRPELSYRGTQGAADQGLRHSID